MSKNRRLKKKMKNMMATVATLVLIVGVSVGITLALLSAKTNVKENTFTGSKGISGNTYETAWDGSTQVEASPDPQNRPPLLDDDGNTITYGYEQAAVYLPGMDIGKDPAVSNLSSDQDIWVMTRVEFRMNARTEADAANNKEPYEIPVTRTEFEKLANVYTDTQSGFNTTYWVPYEVSNKTPGTESLTDGKGYKVDENENNANPIDPSKQHIYYYYYYKMPLNAILKKIDDDPSNVSDWTQENGAYKNGETSGVNWKVFDMDDSNNIDLQKIYYTDKLFTSVKIRAQRTTLSNSGIGANEISLDLIDKDTTDSIFTPDTEKAYVVTNLFDISNSYYTYAQLPGFKINVQSAIIAKEDGDPTNLNDSSENAVKTVLTNLFNTFGDKIVTP